MADTIRSNPSGSAPSLASTARWTAAARSRESARDDALFHDPWAAALAGEEGARWLAGLGASAFGTTPMVIRTRYFDEFLKDATWERGLRQVVIVAAGLDARAYRLDWPTGTRLFELDQPAVLRHKATVMSASGSRSTCQRFTVPVDLTTPWGGALVEKDFDPQQPAAWLLEGLLFYLACEQVIALLDQVSSLSAPGSRAGFDIVNQLTLTSPITRPWIEMQAAQGAPWTGWIDDPRAFMAGRGWEPSLTQPGAPDANYGRWNLPVIPVEAPNLPHSWYVTATKQA